MFGLSDNKPKPAAWEKGRYCRTRSANKNRVPMTICPLEAVHTFSIAIIHKIEQMTIVHTSSSHQVSPTLNKTYPRPCIVLTSWPVAVYFCIAIASLVSVCFGVFLMLRFATMALECWMTVLHVMCLFLQAGKTLPLDNLK